MVTETKSGCLVKTPGKLSSCVSGKRKMHKGRQLNSSAECSTSFMNSTIESSAYDMETTITGADAGNITEPSAVLPVNTDAESSNGNFTSSSMVVNTSQQFENMTDFNLTITVECQSTLGADEITG